MKDQSKRKYTKAVRLLFYLYIILLSYFLFFSERYGMQEYRSNLVLFKEIKRFIRYRELLGIGSFVINILGNVFAFAPFGFMLPLLNKKYRHFFYVAFLSFIFSLVVETVQLATKVGIFDVDDILLNSIGGIVGYLLFAICNFMAHRLHRGNYKKKGIVRK